MMTQTTDVSGTCRLVWISGSASTTIVVSTAVMRTPAMITVSARPGRAAPGDPGAVAEAPPSPAETVLEEAISLA